MSSNIAFTHEAGSVTVLIESPHYMTPVSIASLSAQDVTMTIASLLDAKRAQQAYLAQHANDEPAPETKREGSASTWPAPAREDDDVLRGAE